MNPPPILHSALDHFTAEKMLSGPLAPGDAPPGYGKVAALLRAAAAPEEEPEANPDKQRAAVAAMVAVITDGVSARWSFSSRRRGARRRGRVRMAAALVAATMVLGTGLAFAGALPSPAQNAAAKMFAKFGVTVPGDQGLGTAKPPKQGQGPDVNGPAKYGLCNAYASGQGGQNGNKNNAVPFQNLQKAATGAGQTIDEFCAGATPGGKTEGNSGSSNGKSQGNHGKSGDAPGANGQANGEGKGSGPSKKDALSSTP